MSTKEVRSKPKVDKRRHGVMGGQNTPENCERILWMATVSNCCENEVC